MMLAVDVESNPHGQRAEASCEWCGIALGGLVQRDGIFMHESAQRCTEAEQLLEDWLALLAGDEEHAP